MPEINPCSGDVCSILVLDYDNLIYHTDYMLELSM